jgi:hypothetical protein
MMPKRKIARARNNIANDDDGPSWRLARRGPIRAYDEYSDAHIELKIGQREPTSIQGLVIDFRYMDREGEITRRSLLCWQCGRDGNRIYVRGYCPFREELRTFRIDRMADVIVLQGDRETSVHDITAFFAAFAATRMEAGDALSLEPPQR